MESTNGCEHRRRKHIGGLLNTGGSTTPAGYEGGGSRCGGEELNTPAMKRKCVHSEDRVSLMSGLGVCRKIVSW